MENASKRNKTATRLMVEKKLLAEEGIIEDLDAPDYDLDAIELFLENGADVNYKYNNIPLIQHIIYCISSSEFFPENSCKLAVLLYKYRADLGALDGEGNNAFHIMATMGYVGKELLKSIDQKIIEQHITHFNKKEKMPWQICLDEINKTIQYENAGRYDLDFSLYVLNKLIPTNHSFKEEIINDCINIFVKISHHIVIDYEYPEKVRLIADAIRNDYDRLVKLCQSAGINVNAACDEHGNTLLHLAVAKHDSSLVKALLKTGIEVYPKNNQGKTPLQSYDPSNYKFYNILFSSENIRRSQCNMFKKEEYYDISILGHNDATVKQEISKFQI